MAGIGTVTCRAAVSPNQRTACGVTADSFFISGLFIYNREVLKQVIQKPCFTMLVDLKVRFLNIVFS